VELEKAARWIIHGTPFGRERRFSTARLQVASPGVAATALQLRSVAEPQPLTPLTNPSIGPSGLPRRRAYDTSSLAP
jgi:hypothetical protein